MKTKMKIIDVLLQPFGARDGNCPTEDSVLAYSENTLSSSSRLRVERHFAGCNDCRELLAFLASETGEPTVQLSREDVTEQTNRVLGYIRNDELSGSRSAPKAKAAGGFYVSYPKIATLGLTMCAVLVAAMFFFTNRQSSADGAMADIRIGQKDYRRTEGRISGGFERSTYKEVTRGDDANTDNLHFDRALDKLRSVDEANASLKDTLTLARAYVARGKPYVEHGLGILTGLAKRGLDTAEVLNDTGVAYLQMEEYDKAIDCFTRALAKTPGYDEALFNKALAEQRANLNDDARRDWQRFIDQCSDEKWRTEAADHLRELNLTR